MTTSARLAVLCFFAASPAALALAADAPVVIERAPDADQSAAQAELATLRRENEQLKASLAAATAARDVSDASAKEITQELAALRVKVARLDKPAAAEASTQLADAQNRLAALQTDNALLRAAAADQVRLTAELEKLRQEKAAAAALPDNTAKLTETEEKLATALRSYSLLQAENEQLKSAPASAAKTAELAAKLADTENKLATTLTSFSQLQAENEQLKSAAATAAAAPVATEKSAELAAKLADTENKLGATLTSFSQLQAENERLKSAAADQAPLAAEVEKLRRENAELAARAPATASATTVAPATDEPRELADTEAKLATALRSYSLLQNENDQLKAAAATAAEKAQALAAKTADESAAQISALADELRQNQARANALAAENAQLKTRLALVGPPPGSTLASPVRPGSAQAEAALQPTAPGPQPETAAPAARTHVVVPGDSLTKLARQYLGNANRWDEILRANRDVIKNENVLPVGATLHIP